MARSNFWRTSGVITDRCNSHGTWLDADELEQIAEFIMSGGRPGASSYRPRTDEDLQRSRAATSFQEELLSQGHGFKTPADRFMRSHEPDDLLGTLLKILKKVLD